MSNDVGRQVRKEKEEYEKTTAQEAESTKTELETKDNLIPVSDTGKQVVDRLMKNYYDEETVQHLTIAEDKIPALVRSLRTLDKNVIKFAGPLICKGPKCPMSDKCPLQKTKIAPVGHSCPIELMLIDQWEKDYVEDLGVDLQSKVEVDMVRDMIEADLIDWRASNELAKNGLFDWNSVGLTPEGKPIMRKEEAVAIGIKLKFKSRKDRLREDLMATRKMKAKFGLSKNIDPSKFASSLTEKYRKIKEAEAEVIDDKNLEMDKGEMKLGD